MTFEDADGYLDNVTFGHHCEFRMPRGSMCPSKELLRLSC